MYTSVIATCAIIANFASAVNIATQEPPAAVGCANNWYYEGCSFSHWRHPCAGEFSSDTEVGWVYWNEREEKEYWVNSAGHKTFWWCYP